MMWRYLVCLLCALLAVQAKQSYDGYQVIEVVPKDVAGVEFLQKLANDIELDFWLESGIPGRPSHIMAPPTRVNGLLDHFLSLDMAAKVINVNVQASLEETDEAIARRQYQWNSMNYDYENYNDFDTIMAELQALADDCPAGVTCALESLGDSYEGNPMQALTMTAGGSGGSYLLDATIHAREWLATTTLMHIANTFVRNYSTISEATHLVDNYNWVIMPLANPDGYIYTWTDDRMWRKSRLPNDDSACVGTDLNRNFEYYWGQEGASNLSCSSTYHGASPANNLETQAITNKVRAMTDLQGYVNYHTYGQLFLHPWSHFVEGTRQCYEPSDSQDLQDANDVAVAAATAIEQTHNTEWAPGVWCTELYVSSGTSIDDTKVGTGVKYTYTPELRGDRFDPLPDEIQPAYEEMWNGLVAMVQTIEQIEGSP